MRSPWTEEVSETDLLAALGLPRHSLKEKRAEFIEGVDWKKGERGTVKWSADAAGRLLASFAPAAEAYAEPAPEKLARRIVLDVANGSLPNKTLVACVLPGGDPKDRQQWILVKVRDSRRFLAPMQLLAEEVPGVKLWRFLGAPDAKEGAPVRYPRFRGRWGIPGEKAALNFQPATTDDSSRTQQPGGVQEGAHPIVDVQPACAAVAG